MDFAWLEFFQVTVAILVAAVYYLYLALALFTIAQRRRVKGAWCAWVPFFQHWILGRLSDDYSRKVQKKKRYWRWGLPAVTLLRDLAVGWAAVWGLAIVLAQLFVAILQAIFGGDGTTGVALVEQAQQWYVFLAAAGVLLVAQAAVKLVVLLRVYRSCNRRTAVWFAVFGALFGIFVPIFLWIDMHLDDPVYLSDAGLVAAE